ncbi:MAG: hypothetical protein AAB308_16035, partial [Nitrospirota bacterium]
TIPKVEEDLCRDWLRNDRMADRHPLFRGMSATDSEETRKSGRVPSESLAGSGRNTQSDSKSDGSES